MFRHSLYGRGFMENNRLEQHYYLMLNDWFSSEHNCSPGNAELLCKRVFQVFGKPVMQKTIGDFKIQWVAIRKIAEQELIKFQQTMQQNFGLSEIEFNELVADLCQNNDSQLYENIFLQHFRDCMRFLKREYNANHQDAYDAAMETMIQFGNRLKAGKIQYGNLRFLFTQMARQIYFKWLQKQRKRWKPDEILLPEQEPFMDKETLFILDKAWDKLSGDCQKLLKNYYYHNVNLAQLSEASGRSANALRKQKQRCIEKLRKFFIELL